MKQSLHLSKAPIIEAVIDVRAQTPSELSIHLLSELGAEFGLQYEAIKPINVVEFEFKTAPGQSPQQLQNILWCKYYPADQGQRNS